MLETYNALHHKHDRIGTIERLPLKQAALPNSNRELFQKMCF